MFLQEIKTLRRGGIRVALFQLLVAVSAFSSVLPLWFGLTLLTNCASPVVVVLSGSMEPAFRRRDLLFLANHPGPYLTGDVLVYNAPDSPIPIVHRVIDTRNRPIDSDPSQLMLTKGDNNHIDDLELYNGLEWLEPRHIVGKVHGYLPYIGYASIFLHSLRGATP